MTEPVDHAAVLMSGGLDSAVLCWELLRDFRRVTPIFVRSGLRWEAIELESLARFLAAVDLPALDPLVVLDEPVADIYGAHWSTTGQGVPAADTEDEAVYLPGRNLLLVVKAAVWCRLRGRQALALGGSLRLIRPFDRLHKHDVIRRGRRLPLHLTFSCIDPVNDQHCGICNKCAERCQGFREAGVADLTRYAR